MEEKFNAMLDEEMRRSPANDDQIIENVVRRMVSDMPATPEIVLWAAQEFVRKSLISFRADAIIDKIGNFLDGSPEGHDPTACQQVDGLIEELKKLPISSNAKYKADEVRGYALAAFGSDDDRRGYREGTLLGFARRDLNTLRDIIRDGR
jgi:hypothetical protein